VRTARTFSAARENRPWAAAIYEVSANWLAWPRQKPAQEPDFYRWRQIGGRRGGRTAMSRSSDQPINRPGRIHVVRIGIEPMASQHRDQAITVLAALIASWQQDQDADAKQADVRFAILLPLPGPASDTDHAA
jgi:hypothetical protein